ncbi:deoxycytidylate deaminase [Gordonia phage Sixama]|uniref:Deoxycytidylate deaminase n=1 Tax=Gordonia phage Sixama TaxID=2653271 RepID=A0A5Q2F773_9CAUD|nr:dCMP deaminase [Gordonia phage Sixama]QGF20325.1 deoxycytidylate deaminase [Gordonia phage Sixama]
MAEAVAERSKCSRAKIGCVIVDRGQVVISTGYNGPPPNYLGDRGGVSTGCRTWCERAKNKDTDPSYSTCPSNHAEANAIVRADWSRMAGSTAYVTGAVCITCAKLLAAAGVTMVVHRVSATDSHRRPQTVESFLKQCGVSVLRVGDDYGTNIQA